MYCKLPACTGAQTGSLSASAISDAALQRNDAFFIQSILFCKFAGGWL